eukprot:NODE_3927_length_370_cov_241.317757_g3351_i0.p1 GENE.NODE_3927_length_370_cov_241.317757_g3351_i0~~NODE_3927_length_370_cov_241.317757_g3351_i0.p1  ORF type:complete len:68 (+),score=29.20 NODE_3927_length_370_cov_241.317757_g3351_i0:32-205(+)
MGAHASLCTKFNVKAPPLMIFYANNKPKRVVKKYTAPQGETVCLESLKAFIDKIAAM